MPRRTRIGREKKTIKAMTRIFCRANHRPRNEVCADCGELLEYSSERLDRCPYGESKPTCAKCPIHCYNSEMRQKVREVMRFSGPKMILRRPYLAMMHVVDGMRRKNVKAPIKRKEKHRIRPGGNKEHSTSN